MRGQCQLTIIKLADGASILRFWQIFYLWIILWAAFGLYILLSIAICIMNFYCNIFFLIDLESLLAYWGLMFFMWSWYILFPCLLCWWKGGISGLRMSTCNHWNIRDCYTLYRVLLLNVVNQLLVPWCACSSWLLSWWPVSNLWSRCSFPITLPIVGS